MTQDLKLCSTPAQRDLDFIDLLQVWEAIPNSRNQHLLSNPRTLKPADRDIFTPTLRSVVRAMSGISDGGSERAKTLLRLRLEKVGEAGVYTVGAKSSRSQRKDVCETLPVGSAVFGESKRPGIDGLLYLYESLCPLCTPFIPLHRGRRTEVVPKSRAVPCLCRALV